MFVLQVVCSVIFVYGLLSLIQDITNEFTYKRISHNMKIVVFAKNLEKNLEQFLIELSNIKKANSYKQIIVVDLDKRDDINKIRNRLLNNEINVELLSCDEGEEYTRNFFGNENISFI